jgi:hypothetical protein
MTFRIRKEDDSDQWAEGEKAYYKHLDQFPKTSDRALWKYFYWDFFHDGCVESLVAGRNLKAVLMRLECPNIKRLHADGQFAYVGADFTCTFKNIVHLRVEEDPPTQWYDAQDSYAVFHAAEINTSPQLEAFTDADEMERFSSMIIQLRAHDTLSGWRSFSPSCVSNRTSRWRSR